MIRGTSLIKYSIDILGCQNCVAYTQSTVLDESRETVLGESNISFATVDPNTLPALLQQKSSIVLNACTATDFDKE